MEGGGALGTPSGDRSQNIVYTAPGSNANCASNPIITVADSCGRIAKVTFAVNAYNPAGLAALSTKETRGFVGIPGPPYCHCFYYNYALGCGGGLSAQLCGYASESCTYEEKEEILEAVCAQARNADNCTNNEWCECADGGTPWHDVRGDTTANGCCPDLFLPCMATINNLFDASPLNASGGEGITISALITYESGTSGNWTLSIGGTGRTFQGSGTSVSEYWNGRDSEGKKVDPGKYPAQLNVQVAGSSCQNGTETKTATIEVTESTCQNQEPGTCKPVYSLTVPTDPPQKR